MSSLSIVKNIFVTSTPRLKFFDEFDGKFCYLGRFVTLGFILPKVEFGYVRVGLNTPIVIS